MAALRAGSAGSARGVPEPDREALAESGREMAGVEAKLAAMEAAHASEMAALRAGSAGSARGVPEPDREALAESDNEMAGVEAKRLLEIPMHQRWRHCVLAVWAVREVFLSLIVRLWRSQIVR